MSTFVFDKPICPKCGGREIYEHPCLHDRDGNWLNKKQREANPSVIIPSCQMSMFVGDRTWLTCTKCGYELNDAEIVLFWEECRRLSEGKPFTFREKIGTAVTNPRGLKGTT